MYIYINSIVEPKYLIEIMEKFDVHLNTQFNLI